MDIASAGISAGAGLIGSIGSMFNQNKILKAQREENQKNREFNANESALARDFALQMFNRNNAYNDPSAVAKRLSDAGMHPALAFGGISPSSATSPSGNASASGSVNPPSMDFSGITNSPLVAAQIRNIDADTANKKAETPWIDRLHAVEESLGKVGIDVQKVVKSDKEKDIEVKVKTLERLDSEIKQISSVTELTEQKLVNLKTENAIREIEKSFKAEEIRTSINRMLSGINLTDAQAVRVGALLAYEIKSMEATTRQANANASNSEFQFSLSEEKARMVGLDGLSARELGMVGDQLRSYIRNIVNSDSDADLVFGPFNVLFGIAKAVAGLPFAK